VVRDRFPSAGLLGHAGVIALPHLGASTREAEDNSAIMVVDQLRDYSSTATCRTRLNFPTPRWRARRRTGSPSPTPTFRNMLGAISHALGRRRINIHNMLNKSKGEMAYTLVDADSPFPPRCWTSCAN